MYTDSTSFKKNIGNLSSFALDRRQILTDLHGRKNHDWGKPGDHLLVIAELLHQPESLNNIMKQSLPTLLNCYNMEK